MNLVSMSSCTNPSSGFWVRIVSFMFSTLISWGTLYITSLRFLSFGTETSRSFPHLSLIEALSKYASSEVPFSVSTLPSFSDLKYLTPTFIVVGFMLVFTTDLIASVDRLFLDFTSRLNRLSLLVRNAWEYVFLVPSPGDGSPRRLPSRVVPVPILDGTAIPLWSATLLVLSSSAFVSSPPSRFISLFHSSPLFFRLVKIRLSVLTDSTMSFFRSFRRLPLLSVICSSVEHLLTLICLCQPSWLLASSPVRCPSSIYSSGLRQTAYGTMPNGHPCLTEHLIAMGWDRKPFICTADVALL